MILKGLDIKQMIKKSVFYKFITPILNYIWVLKGKPVPPPHFVKVNKILFLSKLNHTDTLIETGTFRGDMIFATKEYFKKIISIELDGALFKNAKAKFANNPNITILNGNSEEVLPKLLTDINRTCTFWLDGHYSGAGTSSGIKETPIIGELSCILKHQQKHVILIDDARCFGGTSDYPTIDQLRNLLVSNDKKYTLRIEDDIIIIV